MFDLWRMVDRGAYPTIKNFRFLRRLHLKTIASLTPETEPNRDLRDFCQDEGIVMRQFFVKKFQVCSCSYRRASATSLL